MSAPVIDVRAVTRIYRTSAGVEVRALDRVSLRIGQGELVAVMGASGSGKTTLMNILGCLDSPTGGRYLLGGLDVGRLEEVDLSDLRARRIGFVFQSYNLVPRTSALSNVEMPLAYAGLSRVQRRRRATAALEAVGMGDRLSQRPNELSGGQQQRVAIARAIVTHPALILADEPTGNLDSRSGREVLDLFEDLHDQGHTVVLVTHEPDVAARARRLIVLADGRVVEDRPVAREAAA